MNDDLANKWIELAKEIAINPHIPVRCPVCSQYLLEIFDEKVDETHFDRNVRCPECDFSEAIFMNGDPVRLRGSRNSK